MFSVFQVRAAFVAAFAVIALFMATPAQAQLVVDKLWVDLDSTTSARGDVVLRNESADRYYITVAPVEMVRPGHEDEARVERTNPEELGLLVSPSRIILEPGATRAIRIVSINPTLDAERIYRIRVTPEVGEIEGAAVEGDERGINLKVLTAYDLLVVVRPREAQARVVAERSVEELVLRNLGNTNTLLLDGQVCVPIGSSEACQPLLDRRLYAGSEWRIPLPANNAVVKFRERTSASSDDRNVSF